MKKEYYLMTARNGNWRVWVAKIHDIGPVHNLLNSLSMFGQCDCASWSGVGWTLRNEVSQLTIHLELSELGFTRTEKPLFKVIQ